MNNCAHMKIDSALDRWHESHWHLHQVENNYHSADTLRYSMNAFVRSVQEVPDLVSRALQGCSGFAAWHRPVKDQLEREDNLFSKIIEHRNFIVHRAMLVPGSKAYMAAIRGYTVKMALPFYVDPFEDSDAVVERYLRMAKTDPIILGMLSPDEVQVLAVIREWHLDGIEDELITAFRKAWCRIGQYLSDVLEFVGGQRLPNGLPDCFVDVRNFQYKKYCDINLEELYESAQKVEMLNAVLAHNHSSETGSSPR